MKCSVCKDLLSIPKMAIFFVLYHFINYILFRFSALIIGFIYGCIIGWTSALVTLSLSNEWPIVATKNDISWLASISFAGSIFSVLLCSYLSNRISRKMFLTFGTVFYILIWVQIVFTSSINEILVCVFLCGVVSSVQFTICSMYIGEMTNPRNREIICTFFHLAIAVGIQVEFFLSSFNDFRLLAMVPLIGSVLALFTSSIMLESPYYLVSQGKDDVAMNILCYLNHRSNEFEAQDDLTMVRKFVNEQKSNQRFQSNLKVLLLPGNLKLTIILVVINGLSVMNCCCIITCTGSYILKDFKSIVNGNVFVNIYFILRILCLGFSFITIKKFARRTLFLFGLCTGGLVQLGLAFCYYTEERNGNSVHWLVYVIVFLHLLFLIIFKTTFSGAIDLLKIEVFPHSLKGFYTSILTLSMDWFEFTLIQSYFYAEPIVGNSHLMAVYGLISFLLAAIIFYFVQDTTGKTLLQIRTDLNGASQYTPLLDKKVRRI